MGKEGGVEEGKGSQTYDDGRETTLFKILQIILCTSLCFGYEELEKKK